MSTQITEFLERPVWEGGRTLHVGEGIVFLGALACIFWLAKIPLKSMWVWVALVMLLIAMILF